MGIDLIFLAISLIFSVLSALLAPKPEPPPAPEVGKFDMPNVEQGIILQKVYGTAWVKSPSVVWWGDIRAVPITKKAGKK